MCIRHRTVVRWLDGRKTAERLFEDQATGSACFYCSLSDGDLKPLAGSSAVGLTAHRECLPKATEGS